MTHAQFPAARVAAAAKARLAQIQDEKEPRDEKTERVEHLLAIARAFPANDIVSLGLDDFVLLRRHFPDPAKSGDE